MEKIVEQESDYEKIESIWETHVFLGKTSYADSLAITRSLQDFGLDTVLEALRVVYKRRKPISNFAYVSKVAENLAKEKELKPAKTLKNQYRDKSISYDDSWLSKKLRHDRVYFMLKGYDLDVFVSSLDQSGLEIKAVLDEWIENGGEHPTEAIKAWWAMR